MTIRLTKNPLNIHPIYSPRTSYKKIKEQDEKMIADMTLNFDKLTISMLKQEFQLKDNKLFLPDFITIASKHLKFWQVDLPNRQHRLVRYLTYLFNQIDINGNGDMEWQEFTNYIIEKATVLKNLKSKNDEIKHYIKSQITPKLRIDGLIQKLEYLPQIDKIAFYEEGSNTISFLNAETGQLCQKNLSITPKKLVVNISSVRKQKSGKVSIRKKDLVLPTNVRVLDMLYLPDKKYKILLVATSDGYVRGWKYTQNGIQLALQPDNQEQAFEHHFISEIYCLAWDNINEVLYCGQKNGSIYMWNLKTDLEKTLTEPHPEKEGEGEEKVNLLITSMITMPKLQFMASGRMDGKLILWDTINSKKKWVYKEHTRGILSLVFNQTMILLFSAGFDHKICIWNPYISSLIHKIQGHLSPILTLRVIESTHQLISMDSEGIVKITDTRRFNIISSFAVQTQGVRTANVTSGGTASCFITINKPAKQILRLVFAGRTISFYEYDKNYNPFTADEHTVVSCRYVKQKQRFFTPAGNKVKVWSALNGDVEKIYMDVTPNEITAFDFDFLKKRMIIGDSKGNIALYNTANGAKMKNLTHHSAEITHLIATQNTEKTFDIFISCGLDNEIRISRETQESFEVVRTICLKKDLEVTCLRFCPENRLVIVATNVGNLAFFDIQTGKNVGTYLQNANDEFTSVSRACKEVVIVSCSNGNITLVGVPPFPYRFQQLTTFKHRDCEKQGVGLGVRLSAYSVKHNLLYVVDDKMYLTCYELSQMFNQISNSELSKQKIEFERRNLIRDILLRSNILMRWQVKAHNQTIRVLQYIEEEDILMTASFDRKVKLWRATDGHYVDSLQQNYNKTPPEPLAYYDVKKKYLYTKDRKHAFDQTPITSQSLDFDPFIIELVRKDREEYFPPEKSNKDWNLTINFEEVVQTEKEQFEEIASQLNEFVFCPTEQQSEQTIRAKKLLILERKQKVMRQIRNEGLEVQTDTVVDKQPRKHSKNYFRRSMVKCIQNFVDKNDSLQLIQQLKTEKDKLFGSRRHLDYVPIYKTINKTQKTPQQIKQHKQYMLDLAKRDTLNIINSRKTSHPLSREQSQAANRLYRMLKTADSNNLSDNAHNKQYFSKCQRTSSERNLNTKSAFYGLRRDKTLLKLD